MQTYKDLIVWQKSIEFTKENAQFINIAYGSTTELETQLIIAKDLQFIAKNGCVKIEELLQSVLKLLYNYRKYLKS